VSALRLFALSQTHPVASSCTGECQKSGPLGLLVILLLCVACYFLFKSLSRHLRNVRDHFPDELPPDPSAAKRPVATTLPAVPAGGDGNPIAITDGSVEAGLVQPLQGESLREAGQSEPMQVEPVQAQPGAAAPDPGAG
jgi:hypothetical protein